MWQRHRGRLSQHAGGAERGLELRGSAVCWAVPTRFPGEGQAALPAAPPSSLASPVSSCLRHREAYSTLRPSVCHTLCFLPDVSGTCGWAPSSSPRSRKHTRLRSTERLLETSNFTDHGFGEKASPHNEWEITHFWGDGNVGTDGSGPKLDSWVFTQSAFSPACLW